MVSNTRAARKYKDELKKNIAEGRRLSNLASESAGLRRSNREAPMPTKMAQSPQSNRELPMKRKAERSENQNTPSPLRRSDRCKKIELPSTDMREVETGSQEFAGAKRQKISARSFRAQFKEQRRSDSSSDFEELRTPHILSQVGGNDNEVMVSEFVGMREDASNQGDTNMLGKSRDREVDGASNGVLPMSLSSSKASDARTLENNVIAGCEDGKSVTDEPSERLDGDGLENTRIDCVVNSPVNNAALVPAVSSSTENVEAPKYDGSNDLGKSLDGEHHVMGSASDKQHVYSNDSAETNCAGTTIFAESGDRYSVNDDHSDPLDRDCLPKSNINFATSDLLNDIGLVPPLSSSTKNAEVPKEVMTDDLGRSVDGASNAMGFANDEQYIYSNDMICSTQANCPHTIVDAGKGDCVCTKFIEYWVPVQITSCQLEQYCETLHDNSAILCSS